MRFKPTVMLTVAIAGALAASIASAQSLAEVAREARAQREELKAHGKLYTNADLKPSEDEGGSPASQGAAPSGAAGAAAPAGSPASVKGPASPAAQASARSDEADASGKTSASPVKDRAYWHTRITDARTALDQTQVLLAALQSRINALTADFASRDDPVQRAGIEQNRVKALAELAHLKTQARDQTKAIADIEEAARRAGVPPGWLR